MPPIEPLPHARVDAQPLARLRWVPVERLRSNTYNPNKVFAPELRLLKLSLLDHGWTQPLVVIALPDDRYEVVDGFHRWTLASSDADVYGLTGGYVPIVPLPLAPGSAAQMFATIRHNRARGVHGVLPMAEIVRNLIDDHGYTQADVCRYLSMDPEEADRLYDRAGMTVRGGAENFNHGWVPE